MIDKIVRQKEHFDRIAGTYEDARRHPNHLLLKELIWHDFLARHDELKKPGLRVLEAMCGFADGKEILEKHLGIAIDYAGFDYSDAVVDTVRTKRPDLAVERQDATRFSSERRNDLVLLIGGLHHVPHVAGEVVRRLGETLGSGGLFISFEPTHGNRLFEKARRCIYRKNPLFDQETERDFSLRELFGFFRAAGFELADVMYPGLLSYVLYYNPDAFPALNVGGARMVRASYAIDRLFMRASVGRAFSFATLALWRKK